jgi:glyoxylase-like metal-dependent hydrolase (beta-lactamase superfamily II)
VTSSDGWPVVTTLPDRWIHGTWPGAEPTDPPIQVHRADEDTFLLRQSKSLTYEAPFLYLLFGRDRALLLDTGAVADPARMPLRSVVDDLIDSWLAGRQRPGYELVVVHSHGHGDHVAGDAQFAGRASTRVVGREVEAVREFFGFSDWPGQSVTFDLGGRALEVTGIPGHHRASIAIYDPRTGFLLTGDTVYPGRLYVEDPPAFRASLERMVAITDSRPVTRVMGCHVEMTRTPRRDYPLGTTYQPDEAPLQMTVRQLRAVAEAADTVGDRKGAHVFDDFAIFIGRCTGPLLRQVVRRAGQSVVWRGRRRA